MAYGRRESAIEVQPCVNNRGCGAIYGRVERVDQIERYGIPAELQPVGQSAYHCLHCNWVWFGTRLNIKIAGRWDGVKVVPIENPDVVHREPKPKKSAAPYRGLKGRGYKGRSK